MPESARPTGRFMSLAQVADELSTSVSQTYALVRGGDFPAIKVGGGRGQWRVEREQLEDVIERMYDQTPEVRGHAPARRR